MGGQPLGGRRVAVFGRLAQGEQRLLAAGDLAGPGDGQHLVELQEGRLEAGRRLGEGAVPATVPAQHRQRDEHLGGEGEARPVSDVPQPGGFGQERVEGRVQETGGGDRGHGGSG